MRLFDRVFFKKADYLKTWRKRYFKLYQQPPLLTYYHEYDVETGTTPKGPQGSISLSGAKIVVHEHEAYDSIGAAERAGANIYFTIYASAPRRNYPLVADYKTAQMWIEAIARTIRVAISGMKLTDVAAKADNEEGNQQRKTPVNGRGGHRPQNNAGSLLQGSDPKKQIDKTDSAGPSRPGTVTRRPSHPEREARQSDNAGGEEEGWEAWAGRKIRATAAEFYDDAKELAEAVTTGFCLLTLMDELAAGANPRNADEKQITLNLELDKRKESEQDESANLKSLGGLGRADSKSKGKGKLRLNAQTVIIGGEHFAVEAEIDEDTRKGWVVLNNGEDGEIVAKAAT
eukprot:CAMPEP_0167778928 /NCGR_PEP_ID=MMETSP0111_2-20121227/4527_1 /TAXON_ID=91324 /ORGANISM="Lotharella globosa, Strain CCCM811" /LENGTH=343 /DNA_ID=CAMNT_0007669289 /DNA_START=62 /DNA_END=1093 /DNA_ORIENTATION=-